MGITIDDDYDDDYGERKLLYIKGSNSSQGNDDVYEFLNSHRGQMVITKALRIAREVTRNVEPSDSEDMEFLICNVEQFMLYDSMGIEYDRNTLQASGEQASAIYRTLRRNGKSVP